MHLPETTLYRLSGVGLRSSFHVPPPTWIPEAAAWQ